VGSFKLNSKLKLNFKNTSQTTRESRPCDFEDAQQSSTSQHADADRLHELVVS